VGEADVEHVITMQKVKGEEDASTCLVAGDYNGICYLCVCFHQLTVSRCNTDSLASTRGLEVTL
jgi:hypothetical protein